MGSVWGFAKIYHNKRRIPCGRAPSCKEQEILAVFSQRALNELHMAPGATFWRFLPAANLKKTSDPNKKLTLPIGSMYIIWYIYVYLCIFIIEINYTCK